MARSPIPKEPPTMDLTLTLVSELSIHVKNQLADLKIDIPICIKKRRGTPELYYCTGSENSLVFIGDFGDLPIDHIF